MDNGKKSNIAVIVFSMALLLVLALVVALFFRGTPSQSKDSILLPSAQIGTVQSPELSAGTDTEFIQVSNENVLPMLRALDRPAYYYQSFRVNVGSDDIQAEKTVEFWVNQNLVRGQISDGNRTKNILSDGENAWLWYDSDQIAVSVSLSSITVEDLLGVPEFDFLQMMERTRITDAEYLILSDPQRQCIFVCTQDETSLSRRYWIDLESGLLYQGDVLDQNQRVYELRQERFELLAQGDESFSGLFFLPDGSDPFMETE